MYAWGGDREMGRGGGMCMLLGPVDGTFVYALDYKTTVSFVTVFVFVIIMIKPDRASVLGQASNVQTILGDVTWLIRRQLACTKKHNFQGWLVSLVSWCREIASGAERLPVFRSQSGFTALSVPAEERKRTSAVQSVFGPNHGG